MMFARTTRATCGAYMTPMATIKDGTVRPQTTTSVAASAMPGNDMMMSMMRMMTSDTHLRLTAAIAPKIAPKTKAKTVAPKPMTSE